MKARCFGFKGSLFFLLLLTVSTLNVFAQTAVTLIEPQNGATFFTPTNILLEAKATVSAAPVTNVEFFAGTNDLGPGSPIVLDPLGSPTGAPGIYGLIYVLDWQNVPAGNYPLTAVATDTNGLSTASAVADITVLPAGASPPVTITSPTNGTIFVTPTNIQIVCVTPGEDYAPTNLEVFAGTNLLGNASVELVGGFSAFWYLTWTNPPAGLYSLTAVGTNRYGFQVVSAPVNIAVLQGPRVTYGYITAVLRSQCANSPTPPPAVGVTRVGSDYVIETVADADPLNWTNAQRLVTDSIFESLMPLYCALPETGCVTNSVQWNIITYDTNGNPVISGCAASGCQLHSCQEGPPVIVSQPANQSVYVGQTATFSVEASGALPLVYQWVFDGTNILEGATNAVLVLPDVQTNQAGVYQVVVMNSLGGTNSTPATLTVNPIPSPTNPIAIVRIISPANGSVFRAPIDLPLFAYVSYPADSRASVQFYDGTNEIGEGLPVLPPTPVPVTSDGGAPLLPTPIPPVYPTNLFYLIWSNAPVGDHVLTAQAEIAYLEDPLVLLAKSAPVDISILPPVPPPTNHPDVVTIVATDPVAVEGTNSWVWQGETNLPPTWTAWPAAVPRCFTNAGPKTATFTVTRFGETNDDLTVAYNIGGTASNGVDYVALPGSVTVAAGERHALITIVPIDDGPPDFIKSVVLALLPSTNTPPDYLVGFPGKAAAIIVDRPNPTPATGILPDGRFHLCLPGPDAAWFSIEYSTNLTDWTPICTNQVINGSIDFIDPDTSSHAAGFYQAVPATNMPGD